MGLSAATPWTKYYGSTPASLDYPHKTMFQLLSQTARQYPGNTAYIFQDKKTTYAQFMQRIDAAAKGLYHMGIRKGDRVTICMANTPQALDCFYALNRIGAVPNMIHPLSAPAEIAFYLNVSHSKAILTLAQFYSKVDSIRGQLEQPVQILIARIADELPLPLNLLYPLTKPPPVSIPFGMIWSGPERMPPSRQMTASSMTAAPSSTPAAPPAPPRAYSSAT